MIYVIIMIFAISHYRLLIWKHASLKNVGYFLTGFNRMLSCKYSTWQLVAVTCIILASYQVQHFGENAAFGCEPRVSAVLVFTAASIQAKQNKTKHRLLQKIKTRLTRHTAASNYVLKQSKLNTANHTTRHHTGPAMFINKTSPAASQPSQVSL